MYPELESWQRIRDEMDPAGVLGSDLSARVGLTATRVTSKGPASKGATSKGPTSKGRVPS
jgi:hypothetical protein